MRILAGLHPDASVDDVERALKRLGATAVKRPRLLPGVVRAEFASGDLTLLQQVGSLPGVRYAEPEVERSI